jgi:hypothetical protein
MNKNKDDYRFTSVKAGSLKNAEVLGMSLPIMDKTYVDWTFVLAEGPIKKEKNDYLRHFVLANGQNEFHRVDDVR